MSNLIRSITIFTIFLYLNGPSRADSFEDGFAAARRGDYVSAFKVFTPLAEKGNAQAETFLGIAYEQGYVVVQDYKEAVKWYRLAAEQGAAGAQWELGELYKRGEGVAKDYLRAHMWLNLAAASFQSEALTSDRELLAREMTSEQVRHAQDMARKCEQSNFKQCD